jgi:hypothetical protein
MSNQGFIPVDVDIDVLENEPEYIQVRLAGQFTPQESGYWNGLARLTDLNNMLLADTNVDSAKSNFLMLDPAIQQALKEYNPEAEYSMPDESFAKRLFNKLPMVQFIKSPLRYFTELAGLYVQTMGDTALSFQRLASIQDDLASGDAINKVTNPDYWKSGWGGYGKWNQEAVAELDEYYNRATGVMVRGLLDQKNPFEIFTEYGAIDEDMVEIYSKVGTPEFEEIAQRYARHKRNLGTRMVDWAGRFAPLKENPTATDTLREVIASLVLDMGGMRGVKRNKYGEFVTEKLFSEGYGDPSVGIDIVGLALFDPLTYVTFGGSRGIALTASARGALQLQNAVDSVSKLRALGDLFQDPRWYSENNSFITDVNVLREALVKKEPLAAGQARLKIAMDHPAYDNDEWIGILLESTVKKKGKEVPITDMDTYFDWLKTGEHMNALVNGTVNNIITFREEAVALQTRQRRMNDGIKNASSRIFQGLDRDMVIGAKPIPGEILDTWQDIEKAILSRPILQEVGTPEEMINVIAKNEKLLETLAKSKSYAYKDTARAFGELAGRMPSDRAQIFWTDALVDKSLNTVRNYARLVTGDRLRAEFLTQLYKVSSKNDRINMLFNLDKLWLNANGAAVTPAGVALRDAILDSRYIMTETASISPLYTSDIPEIFKVADSIGILPPGPSALMHTTDGITLLPFDTILKQIYDSMGGTGIQRISKSTTFRYGSGYKNIIKKIGYMGHVGSTYSQFSRAINQGLVFALLVPKMGLKNAFDEATVMANVATPSMLADLLYGKGKQLSNINLAITGNNAFQGPIKGYFLDLLGKNPVKFMEGPARKELTSMKTIELKFKDPDTGKEVIQKELITAEEFFGRPPEELIVLAAIEKYGTKFTPLQRQHIYEYYILTGDSVSDAMIGSIVGATYGDSMALGTKLASDVYGKSALTVAFDDAGVKVLSKPYLDTLNRLTDDEKILTQYSYFWRLFSTNKKHNVDLPENFFRANALRTEKDLESFIDSSMREFGWVDNPTAKNIEHAIMVNDEFGQVAQLRALGISEMEISQRIIKNAALEMRYVFHGGTGFNENLWSLIKEKRWKSLDRIDTAKDFADRKMLQREAAGIPEVISDAENLRRQMYYRKAGTYSTAIGKITREEFEEATKGFILQGPLKTDIGFDTIKAYDPSNPSSLYKMMTKGWTWMDRQLNDFTRSDVFLLKNLEERSKLTVNEELFFTHLVEEGATPDNARVQAAGIMANQAKHNAMGVMLKYVDNPTLKSQLDFNMRITGRFIRAANDYTKRSIRWMLAHPASIPYRVGHIGHAADGSGLTHKDEDGNIYVVIPNDGIFWQDVAPAIVMLFNPLYSLPVLTKIGADKVLNGQSIKDSPYWGFFKQAEWNQYKATISLANPSYAQNAGLYTLIGPNMAIPVMGLRELLVGGAAAMQNPDVYNVGLSVDNILLGDISDDTNLARAIIPPALKNYLEFAGNLFTGDMYKHNAGAVASYQAISFMQYNNPKKPEDFLTPEGIYDPTKANEFLNEWRIQVANVLAQKAAFNTLSGVPLALGNPDIPKYLRDQGTVTLTKEYGDILRGVLQFNQENGYPIGDPYTLAVSLHASERPGKLIFQVPKNLRESKIAIGYTQETLSWAVKNKKYLNTYSTAGWIFAPNVGEYDPRVINYFEALDLIPPDKDPFSWNNNMLKAYIEETTVTKLMYKYYQYDREVERLLNDPNNPRRNFADYRREIKARADAEKNALLNGNPLFAAVFGRRDFENAVELESKFNELRIIVDGEIYPTDVTLPTRNLLKTMVRSASELLIVTKTANVGQQYLGDTVLQGQVTKMYEEYEKIASQNAVLSEAWTGIIRPLLDKNYDIPFRIVRKPGD